MLLLILYLEETVLTPSPAKTQLLYHFGTRSPLEGECFVVGCITPVKKKRFGFFSEICRIYDHLPSMQCTLPRRRKYS